MKVFIVFAHPEPQSFNGALYRLACETLTEAGHAVRTSELYAMRFDAVSGRHNFTSVHDASYYKQQAEETHASEVGGFAPEIEAELQKLAWCDLMIWQFPVWWFGLPAILKGWVDRVFAMGRTYGYGRMFDTGPLRGRRALLSFTTGGPEGGFQRGGSLGDIHGVIRPIQRGMLKFVGFDVLAPQMSFGAGRATDEERRLMLDRYRTRLAGIESEAPIDVGEY
jgi:NAD(P)H dehydrogenase (quinone)